MKKCLILALLLGIGFVGCKKEGLSVGATEYKKMAPPASHTDKTSYMLGYDMAKNFTQDSIPFNTDYYLYGIMAALHGDSTLLTPEEIKQLRQDFQEAMMIAQQVRKKAEKAKFEASAGENKIEGDKFLAENKAKPGVITTSTGLQYSIIKEGSGPIPKKDDKVTIQLKAYFINGKEFDNTYKNPKPVVIDVNQQKLGWQEALMKMKVGSIWKLVLPPALGWGDQGQPPVIPPEAVTIFEMELVSIDGKATEPPNKGLSVRPIVPPDRKK